MTGEFSSNLYYLTIKSDFPAVMSINGSFAECAERLKIRRDEVLYITVLPLSASLLPYTVKLAGGKVRSNRELARAIALPGGDSILLVLRPRYNYIYSAGRTSGETCETASDCGFPPPPAVEFFRAVKRGEMSEARRHLTPDLSAAITDDDLAAFFDEYSDILPPDRTYRTPPDCWLLVDRSDRALPFLFPLENSLISDITEYTIPTD